jgi:hypothetical protein
LKIKPGDKMFANIEEAGNFGSNLAREIKDYTSTRVVKPLEERIKQLEVKIAYLEAKLEAHRSVRYIPQATLEWCDRPANRDGLIQQLDHRMSVLSHSGHP